MSFDTRLLTGLNVLSAVIDAGNFARAGEVLGLTQSGVSRAIQRLEERLGVRLFERTSKSMLVTEEGRRFCAEVLPLLGRLEEAAEDATNASRVARGRLRINVDPTFARQVLAPVIGRFLQRHPGIHLDLVIRDELGDLVADGFDAAIRFGDPEPSALMARRLLQVRIFTCAAPKYLKERGTPKTPRDLESDDHECLLFRDPATGRPFPWEFHRGGKSLPFPSLGG